MPVTKSTITKVFEMIRLTYDNAFAGKSESDMIKLVGIWYDCLKPYPQEVVLAATKNAFKRSEFIPKVATIVKEIEALTASQQESDFELWDEFNSALQSIASEIPYTSCAYDTVVHEDTGKTTAGEARELIKQTYESLHPKIREYCGSVLEFTEIAKLDEEGLCFEKARFMKQIPVITERLKTIQTTSPQLASIIKGLSSGNKQNLLEEKL